MKDSKDPNLDYNQLVRPWKGRLGMIYVKQFSLVLYFQIIVLTALNVIHRKTALKFVCEILKKRQASKQILQVAARQEKLYPMAPLGSEEIVRARNV